MLSFTSTSDHTHQGEISKIYVIQHSWEILEKWKQIFFVFFSLYAGTGSVLITEPLANRGRGYPPKGGPASKRQEARRSNAESTRCYRDCLKQNLNVYRQYLEKQSQYEKRYRDKKKQQQFWVQKGHWTRKGFHWSRYRIDCQQHIVHKQICLILCRTFCSCVTGFMKCFLNMLVCWSLMWYQAPWNAFVGNNHVDTMKQPPKRTKSETLIKNWERQVQMDMF